MPTADLKLTTTQAAERLGVHPYTVRGYANTGRLPFTRTPRGRLIDAAAVDHLQHEQAAHPRGRGRPTLGEVRARTHAPTIEP